VFEIRSLADEHGKGRLMNLSFVTLIGAIAFLASVIAHESYADSTKTQLEEQKSRKFDPARMEDSALKTQPSSQLNEILQKYNYLNEIFLLMDQQGAESKLPQELKNLQADPQAVLDIIALYQLLTEASKKDNEFYGEARWRALYVLGELQDSRATSLLFDIASTPMPSPERVGEVNYKVEYRLRARAIAGLEKLKETELLTQIFEKNDLLRGLAAASLFELGLPPKGITNVDGVKVLGYGDPTDYHTKKKKRSLEDQLLPGRESAPPEGAEEQSIRPTRP